MRSVLTTLSEIGGAALVTLGAFLFAHSLGLVVGGLCLIGIGYLLGREQ
jgi:hypothetical protein